MQLEKLEIKNLYGFMNKSINFNNNLNLLVGINGSGKTSVLNVIYWLLNPSYIDLCTTEFSELSLSFIHEEKKHRIICKQTLEKVTIRLTVDKKNLPILTTILSYPIEYIQKNKTRSLRQRLVQIYSNLEPSNKERETWAYFLQLPKPIVISIDRNLEYKDNYNEPYSIEKSSGPNSIDIAKKYSNAAYAQYNKAIIDLNRTLRNRVLLSSFESSIINLSDTTNSKTKVQITDVNRLEDKFIKFLEQDEVNNTDHNTTSALKNAIRVYADSLREIILNFRSNKKDDPRLSAPITTSYFVNSNQFIRIRSLLDDFSKYEIDSIEAYKEISTFLEAVNHFLHDSNKELFFKKEDGQLYFKLKDKFAKDIKDEQGIENLSSGEKQIIILLTSLAFGDIDGKIVIIDEPEISLHPKWQDDFLQQISKVTSPDAQLIIATHSPSIVGDLEEKCKVLLPYNS